MKKIRFSSLFLALIILISAFLPSCSKDEKIPNSTITAENIISTEEEKEPEPYLLKTVKIGATGDILIHSPILNTAKKLSPEYDFNFIFPQIKETYSAYDYMIANLEVPMGGTEAGEYLGYPRFNIPDTLADALKNAGIDMLLTANNHMNDAKRNGFLRTMQVLEDKKFDYIGTRQNENIPFYKIVDFDGLKIGMICYTYSTFLSDGRKSLNGNPLASDISNLVNAFDYDHLDSFYADAQNALNAMKNEGADFNIFYMHWGNEYKYKSQNSYQTEMAQKLCDMGADFIIGGHPHVIQPFETLSSADGSHKTFCLYSTGNSISNQRKEVMDSEPTGHTEDGIIYELGFEVWSNGEVKFTNIDLLPTWVNMFYRDGNRLYEIVPLDTKVPDWSIYGCDVAKAKASYNRTMEIVGEGINSARASLGLEPKITHID